MFLSNAVKNLVVVPHNFILSVGSVLVYLYSLLRNDKLSYKVSFFLIKQVHDFIETLQSERRLIKQHMTVALLKDRNSNVKAMESVINDSCLSERRLRDLCILFCKSDIKLYLMNKMYLKERAAFRNRMNSFVYALNSAELDIKKVLRSQEQRIQKITDRISIDAEMAVAHTAHKGALIR